MREIKHLDKKIATTSKFLDKGGKATVIIGTATGQPELIALGAGAVAAGGVGKEISKLLKKPKKGNK